MANIYLPEEYVDMPCKVVNNGYIRVYRTTNTNQSNVVYDIYIDQDYQVKQGTSSYSASTQCDYINNYTSDWWYRRDFKDIVITYFILLILFVYIPYKVVITSFFRRAR